jgi:3-hydroxybutyryl-CoA dehydrogenase
MERIGIVGAGQMGAGIAHVCALAGLQVIMVDSSSKARAALLPAVQTSLLKLVRRGVLDPDAQVAAVERVTVAADVTAMADVDFVIEAATEDVAIKRAILQELTSVVRPSCIIASNTSSVSISGLAAYVDKPGRFIGMHFFNPVPVMDLVEVIRGLDTSDACHDATCDLARMLGKFPLTTKNSPGFMVNRLLVPMINEAVLLVQEGAASAGDIDAALTLGAGHPMGPLKLADLIGLDTCLAIMQVLHRDFGESKYRPAPLLREYVDAGRLGRKSGRGFFEYSREFA